MKNSSPSFKTHLSYTWQWYLLALVGVIGLDIGIYVLRHTPKVEETLSIYVASDTMDAERLEKDLYEGAFPDSKILKVSVDHSDPDDFYFNLVFSTRGVVNTDLIILPSLCIGEGSYPTYFAPIGETDLDEYIPHPSEWEDFEGKHYGIPLNANLVQYGLGDGYSVFLNKKSEKIGKLGEKGNNAFALEALRWIYA